MNGPVAVTPTWTIALMLPESALADWLARELERALGAFVAEVRAA